MLLSIRIIETRESVFCQFLRGFLDRRSHLLPFKERKQMAPVTGLYKLSFLSAKGHLNWLNRVVNSSGNKYMPIFLSL